MMIDLSSIIRRIQALLAEDTDQSVTYAALEARLALEKVCYDRLRQRHDFVSHAQLQKWQPHHVIRVISEEIDPHVTETNTVYLGKNPGSPPEEDDYVKIGTEIGVEPDRIAKMWNALSGDALHVRMPKSQDDDIPDYGDKGKIRAQVEKAIAELERLSDSTMAWSGFGEEVSFTCACGQVNRRRASLLRDGQRVHCVNQECKEIWKVFKKDNEFSFEPMRAQLICDNCGEEHGILFGDISTLKFGEVRQFHCPSCRHINLIRCQLQPVRRTKGPVD